ncbi:hypothetical protein ACFSKW_28960 [Nonomuraea mangrovi]|uniref:Lipoprotein n=1 Tax=Nonomuraea mangrovi TaxID=2316207 RepID=A0ABW4T2P6_9ACTN
MTGGEREMTGQGIALLLREAADEVELGAVPYAEVVRGGKRRKARRWAATAVSALALAGCAGLLAANLAPTRLQGQEQVATQVTGPPEERHVYSPLVMHLADVGKKRVFMEVWGAPRTDAELRVQKARLIEKGLWDERRYDPHKIGDVWHLVYMSDASGGKREMLSHGVGARDSGSFSYTKKVGSRYLVWGNVSEDVKRIVYNWRSGDVEARIVQVPILNQRWFVLQSGSGDKLESVTTYDAQNRPKVDWE